MSRRRNSTWIAAALALLSAGAAAGDSTRPEPVLEAGVRRDLGEIQQNWSEWLASYELKDYEAEELALEAILERLDELGMTGLPELSIAASARAVDSARLGDARGSARALAAAERLDPGRAEIAFARAAIERQEGSWWSFVISTLEGYVKVLESPLKRRLLLHNAVLWLLMTALLGGCVFVAMLMAVRGPALFGSLLQALRRVVPAPVGMLFLVVLLLWPIALSSGVLVIALNWSVFLWAYAQRSERWVLATLWVLFGLTPLILDEQRRRVSVELSPMARAVEASRRGHLEGRLFADLERLKILLPDSPAVNQLVADQYRRAGQCDRSIDLYKQLVETEPRNAAAWIDLGACHFLRGEYDEAIEYFRRGASLDEDVAQGHFNLSLAYSELYDFSESERALARAQRLDSSRVAEWLEESSSKGVAEVSGGLKRAAAVRRELRRSWILEDDSAAWSSPLQDYLSMPIAVVGLLLSFLAGRLLPKGHLEAQAPPLVDWGSKWGGFYRVLVPGIPELEAGESVRAVAAVTLFAGLLLIPWIGVYGYRLPWGFEPEVSLGWVATVIGIPLFFMWRWRRESAS